MFACEVGHLHAVELLLEHGADTEIKYMVSNVTPTYRFSNWGIQLNFVLLSFLLCYRMVGQL